jgi:hypothetical protein
MTCRSCPDVREGAGAPRPGSARGSRRVSRAGPELAEPLGGGLVGDAEAGAERIAGDRLAPCWSWWSAEARRAAARAAPPRRPPSRPRQPAQGTAVPCAGWQAGTAGLPRNQRCQRGRDSRLLREFRYLACTFLHLSCTCDAPGLLFRWSWPCPAAARWWSANRFRLHARRRAGGCLRPAREHGPALAGSTALAALPPLRARRLPAPCARRDTARRTCHGPGDGSTGTGKTWQPTGDGPACSRRRVAGQVPGQDRGRSAELADRLSGFANLSPFHTAS